MRTGHGQILPCPRDNTTTAGDLLKVAPANTNVEVVFTPYQQAEEQIKAQEQQRILAVFPNFYTSYVWHAAPMSPGQKFRLALRTSIDPVTFGVAGYRRVSKQWQNYFSGYGQGAEGYGKRFGATYADDVIDTFIGSAILPSILHQDPRYFYKGTGSVPSRALYAISTVVICRGDNGRWQPNYSNVAGNLISAGISNLYYPASNRNGAAETIENALISTAEGAATALLQEFVIKKLSRGVPQQPPGPTADSGKVELDSFCRQMARKPVNDRSSVLAGIGVRGILEGNAARLIYLGDVLDVRQAFLPIHFRLGVVEDAV